ncbi:M56 family metallopeptidase [Algoriphagus aestuarii]|nr:M56 family metallopeptidase [Algoriphagus aestuarii]
MEFWFTYLMEGTLGIVLVVLFYRFCIEGLTFFALARITLLGLVSAAVLLPLFSFQFQWFSESAVLPINSSLLWVENQGNPGDSTASGPIFNWVLIPLTVYLSGVIYCLARLIVGIVKTLSWISKSEKLKSGSFTLVINQKFIPASFFTYILLPESPQGSKEYDQILLHESVHIEQGHTWDVLFIQIIKAIFWFNPAIYLLEKQLKEIHEFQADLEVTKSYSPIDYSRLLLKQLSKDCGVQFMNNFNQFQTKKRIMMMNKTKSNAILKNRFLLGIPMLVLMVGLFSCDMAMSQSELIGTWTGTEFQFDQTEGPDLTAMVEGGKALHKGGKLIINEDGTAEIVSGQGDINGSGTFRFYENGNVLILTMNGEETRHEVLELTDEKLVTKNEVAMDTPMGKVAGTITLTYKR